MYENNKNKRDAFKKVTRRRFRDKRSETRATAGNQVNIGLGTGDALNLFNDNINGFELIKIITK